MKPPTHFILCSLAAGLLLTPAASSRGAGQRDLQDRYEKKLAKEFIEYGGWITDYDAARTKAKEEGKVLFVYFSRSYSP